MAARPAVELPVTTLVSLIEKANLGEPHAIFAGGERYVSPRFAEAGGRVDERIMDVLALVQRARIEYYGWITHGDATATVLVAATGRTAAVVTRDDDRVRFDRADPDRLVESLVHRLPAVPAGRGESISIRVADYGRSAGLLRQPVSARAREARRLDALLRAPRSGGARLYTARRDRAGVRQRAKEWLTVLDLVGQGRWAVYATAGRGERAVNAVPATPRLLATKLTELHRSLG